MKKISQSKVNRIFKGYACDLFDKTCENAEGICNQIFPDQPVSDEVFSLVVERLIVEAGAIMTEKKEKGRLKKKVLVVRDPDPIYE